MMRETYREIEKQTERDRQMREIDRDIQTEKSKESEEKQTEIKR